MTVTYARRRSLQREEQPRLLLVGVAPDGRTVVDIDPDGLAGERGDRSRVRTSRMFWSDGPPGSGGWHVFDPRPGRPIEIHQVEEFSADQGHPVEIEPDWQGWIARQFSDRLDVGSWQAIERAWQPDHCSYLGALASALASTALPGSRTVVRLTELPSIVAGVLGDVLSRASHSGATRHTPLPSLVRALGPALCIATRQATGCATTRRLLVGLDDVSSMAALERTGASAVMRALKGPGPGVPIAGPRRSEPTGSRQLDEVEEDPQPAGLLRTLRALTEHGQAPDKASRFGCS